MPLTGNDSGMKKQWLVSPTKEIDEMWIIIEIQNKTSTMNRLKQDIEDLQKGRLLELSAKIKMTELEIASLHLRLKRSQALEASPIEQESNNS